MIRRMYSSLQKDVDKANTRSLQFKIAYQPRLSTTTNIQRAQTQDTQTKTSVFPKYSDSQVTNLIKNFIKIPEGFKEITKTSHLYDDLAVKLSGDSKSTILPYTNMKLTNPTPYQQKSLVENNTNSRLSVTKIIPSIWCELKNIYRLYQGHLTEPTNQSMTRGKIQHLEFELTTHPVEKYTLKDKLDKTIVYELDKNKPLLDIYPELEEPGYMIKTVVPQTEEKRRKEQQEQHVHAPEWSQNSIDLELLDNVTFESKSNTKIQDSNQVITDFKQTERVDTHFTTFPKDGQSAEKEKMLYISSFLKSNEEKICSDFEDLSKAWTRNILRLTDLLKFGECREILVFSIYDLESHTIINDFDQLEFPLDKSRYLTISGIIDHLTIESDYSPGGGGEFEEYQKELKSKMLVDFDLSELIKITNKLSTSWNELLYIKLKDLKTRGYRSIPDPKTQTVHEQQVGIYLKFIKLLSLDAKLSYSLLKINFMKRGIDLDKPIPAYLLIELMLQNNYYFKDFEAIQSGKPLGFPLFDIESKSQTYNPTEAISKLGISMNDIPNRFKFIFQKWETAPTFKYIIARQSQLFESLKPLLGQNKVSIEYSTEKLGKFAEIQHIYSDTQTDWCINEGLKLWFGKRTPSGPQFKNSCAKCEFQSQCGWFIKHGVL